MASAWGESWGQVFADAWGDLAAPELPPIQPRQDSIKWGLGPMIMPKKLSLGKRRGLGKTRQQLQNEAILLTLLM
ncbi:MAG: hypothetical protein CO065_14710 [Comamonadaceae bacterium CG_4_9_14_0_8_um_filter_57_21]|nr:MAG: hypothetical protein CO065_14710 [Comamonadaceae bacterium CG_4_9_14_0_8_um_filter_57_21]